MYVLYWPDLLWLFITLHNGLEMNEYKAYWPTYFALLIYWACQEIVQCLLVNYAKSV